MKPTKQMGATAHNRQQADDAVNDDQKGDRQSLVVAASIERSRFQLPNWLERALQLGITTQDADRRRREMFCNVAALAMALSGVSHLLSGISHDLHGLMPLHIYNALLVLAAAAAPLLHRFFENCAAVYIGLLVCVGHTFVVFALGPSSGLLLYYTLIAAGLFLFGIEHWRQFLALYALALAAMLGSFFFANETGFLLPDDMAFRRQLSLQGLLNAFVINAGLIAFALSSLRRAETALAFENARAEALLETILPRAIAARLRTGKERRIADRLDNVSILFADLVGFTPAARDLPPEEVVGFLDRLYTAFDDAARRCGVQKIKTIGDAYMAIAIDAPHPPTDDERSVRHERTGAAAMALFAIELKRLADQQGQLGGRSIGVRIGIHHGSAVAGVIGRTRFAYDLW
ncbi:MAG: adenylate/guanylate cyclase domain-containing protein, partial [Pseudomonadota bacterium]